MFPSATVSIIWYKLPHSLIPIRNVFNQMLAIIFVFIDFLLLLIVWDTFFRFSLIFLSKRSGNVRFFTKFSNLWRAVAPSSRRVRSSDCMIIKAEPLICRMLVSPLSGFSSEKSYSGSKTHTKPKNAIHTPTKG